MAGCGALSEVSRHLSTRQGSGAAIDYDGRNVCLLIHILVDQDPKMRKEAGLGYKPQGSQSSENSFLHLGPASQRLYNLPKQCHLLEIKSSNPRH